MSFSSQLILVSILKELTKEKLPISYLIENVFLITVDSGKHSEGIGQGETTDQLPHWESFSSQLILVSILKELTKEKLQISYLIENVFLIRVDSGKLGSEESEPLLLAYTTLLEIPCHGSFN